MSFKKFKKKLQMIGNRMIILSYNFERKHTLMWLYYYSLFNLSYDHI